MEPTYTAACTPFYTRSSIDARNKMFLSIIIPHYNLPRELLERCIGSIAQLEMAADYEIIVVDDGSPNPPLWVNGAYPGLNIRLITAPHGGPGAARNRGIEAAQGEYIEFVDADDTLIPGTSYRQCIEKLRNEMPQILHFNYQVIAPGNTPKTTDKKEVTFSNTISGATYMKENNLPGSPCRYFFSKALALEKDIRFPENIFHEDEEFNTILHFHARTLVYSDATLYNYCIREGSTTANNSADFETRRINDMLHIIERLSYFRNTQSDTCSKLQRQGFEHKFTMLCVDAILNMIYNGMSAGQIHDQCTGRLALSGAYPLPKASYSAKYTIFRIFANSKNGIKILRLLLPSKKPAKK